MRRHRRWTRLGHAWPRPRPQPQERRPRTESRRRLRCGRSGRTLRLCASRRSGCPPRPLPLLGARPCRGPRRPLRARPPSSCRVCVTLCRWVSLIPVASRVSVSSAPRHSHRVGCGHLAPCTVPWCVTRFAIFSLLISMCDIIHSTATRSSVRRTSVLAPRLGQSLAASRTKRQRFAGYCGVGWSLDECRRLAGEASFAMLPMRWLPAGCAAPTQSEGWKEVLGQRGGPSAARCRACRLGLSWSL